MTTGGSLDGLVTDVQIFNRMLSEEEAIGYTECSKELTGDIAAWKDEQDWEMVGQIKVVNIDLRTVCSSGGSMEETVMIIPARLSYPGK